VNILRTFNNIMHAAMHTSVSFLLRLTYSVIPYELKNHIALNETVNSARDISVLMYISNGMVPGNADYTVRNQLPGIANSLVYAVALCLYSGGTRCEISAGTSAILTIILRGFSQYLHAKAGIVPRLGHNGFVQNSFQFIYPPTIRRYIVSILIASIKRVT
jgi:hypothetical protein